VVNKEQYQTLMEVLMALYKLDDFYENSHDAMGEDDIKKYDVYSTIDNEKIGSVKNILIDDSGRFRYLVVDTGFWIFGKQILLPMGRSRIDRSDRRVYAVGLTKQQAESLPEFNNDLKLDRDYEERVQGVYLNRPLERDSTRVATSQTAAATTPTNYQEQPDLYAMNDRDHQSLKLYEERLIANKTRRKTGEVNIGKHVETQTQNVAIPVEKEKIIVERTTPPNAGRPVSPGEANFRSGEVAHMDIYEEKPEIRKEAVLREEVNIRKEVEHDTVNAQEQIRREELDIDSEGRPIRDRDI
jgi:uncharacterized protein (TIGR02271 family)